MSCLAPEQLAAAASEGDDTILAHLADCASCQHILDDQTQVRSLVQRMPPVVLHADRRETIAAELMAGADHLPARPIVEEPAVDDATARSLAPPRGSWRTRAFATSARRTIAVVAFGLAAAAALALVVGSRGERGIHAREGAALNAADGSGTSAGLAVSGRASGERSATGSEAGSGPDTGSESVGVTGSASGSDSVVVTGSATGSESVTGSASGSEAVAGSKVAPGSRSRSIADGGAPGKGDRRATATLAGAGDYAREPASTRSGRDIVRLRAGELTVDATNTRPVQIITGTTAITLARARVKVIATRGAVSSLAVFAGSAELTVDGHRVIVEAGTVWERDAARDEALAAFRTGWTALRDGNNAAAIAAFDRATDPVVAEDAVYWSAIASERLHDTPGAIRRYRDLLATFPNTPRASEARSALARLVAPP